MVEEKPDAAQIRSFLKSLAQQNWLQRDERSWWPEFVFHYTDIRNAVRILSEGRLLSRTRAKANGKLEVSSGSSTELADTAPWVRDYVRLYFRPRTPTQFYAEGIQSQATLSASK